GLLDVRGHVIPGPLGALGGANEVVDVVVIDLGQKRRTPGRLGARLEVVEGLDPEVAHPLGLRFELGDLLHDLLVDPLGRLVEVVLRVVEAVALGVVGVDASQLLIGGQRRHLGRNGLWSSHYSTSSLILLSSMITSYVSTGTYAGR